MIHYSEYHIIIMRDTKRPTVLKRDESGYGYRTDRPRHILQDVGCLWDRTEIYHLLNAIQQNTGQVIPILRKFTKHPNLSNCYIVWADQFRDGNY